MPSLFPGWAGAGFPSTSPPPQKNKGKLCLPSPRSDILLRRMLREQQLQQSPWEEVDQSSYLEIS